MSSASSTEVLRLSTTSLRLATMPLRMPLASAFPMPVISMAPSSWTLAMTQTTFEVPMSTPTT